ncbi:hypothetical protein LWM68_15615 [Niabella sp. W65]|nr:hypothetical protein [Niabella sp. W65]MCH7364056.1 hypothetical protein [Niabella sp. W65]
MPVHFIELPYDDTIIDFDGNINLEIADKIKHTTYFSRYPDFDFQGIVWCMMSWDIGQFKFRK